MTQISIAVIGSCNIDVVVEAPKRPLAGETILGSRLIIAQPPAQKRLHCSLRAFCHMRNLLYR